jgi:bacteriocin-like protein
MLGMEKHFAKVDQELNRSALAMENVSPEGARELTDEELEQVTGGGDISVSGTATNSGGHFTYTVTVTATWHF